MKYRLRVYGSLLLIISLNLIYLLLFVTASWYLSDYETFREELQDIVQQNSRWKTWAACASGVGLISGILAAVSLFFGQSDKDFFLWFYEEIIISTFNNEIFRNWRYISGFLLVAAIIFLIFNGDLYLAFTNSLEMVGIVVSFILIVTLFNLIFILFADILRQIF